MKCTYFVIINASSLFLCTCAPGEVLMAKNGSLSKSFLENLSSFLPSYHFDRYPKRCPNRCSSQKKVLKSKEGAPGAQHYTLFVIGVFSPFFAIFLILTLILPYFCKNRALFLTGTPNRGLLNDSLYNYCITLSLFGHLHPLTFYGLDQKYLFMDPETLLDGTPNLE